MKTREATIASLQDTMRQLSKEQDAAVKELDALRVKDSKQREGLEQCRTELEVELLACQDKLGRLEATRQQVGQDRLCMHMCMVVPVHCIIVLSRCTVRVTARRLVPGLGDETRTGKQ